MTGPQVFVTALLPVAEGRVAAEATVKVGAITVRRVKLLRHNGTGWELGLPRRWDTAADAYENTVELDKPLRVQVLQAVVAAYQEHALAGALLTQAEADLRFAARRWEALAVTEPRWEIPARVGFVLAQRLARSSGRLP